MNRFWSTCFIFFAITTSLVSLDTLANVTSVTATVDKNPAMADESLTLTITANGEVDRNDFDPSPLLKDFVVGRTSVSSQTQMVNFNTTRSTTWSTILIPRAVGDYTIPEFDVAGQKTLPIKVTILPVSSNQGGQGRDLFITATTDSPTVYLQQQVKYTVKLHLAVDLQRGSLAAPQLENADIRQIGKDAEYTDIINGRRYRIIERTFAITPQQSGTYRINGPLFEGEVIDNSRQSFGFFNRTKTINRVGPNVDIDVLPIPSGVAGHWMPSEFVQLDEEWQPGSGQYRVGDPITRTLTLTAVGLVEEQLPDISSQYPAEVKTYPDQATTATVERDNTLIAQRVENIAIIPSKAGAITIPSVEVPWFNVVTKQTEYARLPAKTLTILPAVAGNQTQLPNTQTVSGNLPSSPEQLSLPTQTTIAADPWWQFAAIAFLSLWILTIVAWVFHSMRRKSTLSVANNGTTTGDNWQELEKALKTNDAKQVYLPLTKWMAWYCDDTAAALPTSQRKIADEKLDKAIKTMFEQQYGSAQSQWRSGELLEQLTRLRKSRRQSSSTGVHLRSLYPTQNEV